MAAYNGTEKYIFISYAHRDNAVALPIIEGLIGRGMRVWYDDGIEVGSEWAAYIQDRILGCECLILLLSRASVASVNCREEFFLARETEKGILVCYIEDLAPSDLEHGLRLRVPTYQCMYLSRYASVDSFLDAVCRARILEGCGGAVGAVRSAESPMEEEARLLALQGVTEHRTEADATEKSSPATDGTTEAKRTEQAASAGEPHVTAPGPEQLTMHERMFGKMGDGIFQRPLKGRGRFLDNYGAVTGGVYSEGLSVTSLGLLMGAGGFKGDTLVLPPSVNALDGGVFRNDKRLSSVVLNDSIKVIPKGAFEGCTSLTRVSASYFLTHILDRAFYGCKLLGHINLNHGVTHIGDGAFARCDNLISISLPASLKSLGRYALGDTENVAVYYDGTKAEWDAVEKNGPFARSFYLYCIDGYSYAEGWK